MRSFQVEKMSVYKDLAKQLNLGQNLVMTALPGMGLKNIHRAFIEYYKNLYPETIIIDIHPHDFMDGEVFTVKNKLLTSLRWVNTENEMDAIEDAKNKKQKILIQINRINVFEQPHKILKYINSLEEVYSQNLSTVISCDIVSYNSFLKTNPQLFSETYVFKGFKGVFFDALIENIKKQYSLNLNNLDTNKLYSLTYGHAGFVKELLLHFAKTKQLSYDLKKNKKLFTRIIDVELAVEAITQKGVSESILESNTFTLEDLGVIENEKIMGLLQERNKINEFSVLDLENELTMTERNIYHLLKTNTPQYATITEIIENLDKTETPIQSDWSLYKHINNLNKKINEYGLLVENKRGMGYRLSPQSVRAKTF